MNLRDNAIPNGKAVEVRAVEGSGFLEIRAKGYGEKNAAPSQGSVLALEVHNGRLRLLVFADIRQEGPTDVIDLEGTREDNHEQR